MARSEEKMRRRRKQLQADARETNGCSRLKEEALDGSL
jgi:hypothetical protein